MAYIRKSFAHLPDDFEPVTVYGNQEIGAGMHLDENNFMDPDHRQEGFLVSYDGMEICL